MGAPPSAATAALHTFQNVKELPCHVGAIRIQHTLWAVQKCCKLECRISTPLSRLAQVASPSR